MLLTVYHSTSSVFLSSIKEHGLKGIDLRRKFPDLCKAMSEMIQTLDRKYSGSGFDWGEKPGFRENCQRMADINYSNQSNMDYEYGNLYVTPSIGRICIYNTYTFCSELLSYFYRLYQCLFTLHEDKSKSEFDARYPELLKITEIKNRKSIVLGAEVDTDDLLRDTGEKLDENDINRIQRYQRLNADPQVSYRLTRTLMPEEISVMELKGEELVLLGKLSKIEIPADWKQLKITA